MTLPILPYDAAAAKWHGTERVRLSRMGLMPAFADGQIAAIAMVNGLIWVTNNVRDFQGFEGAEGAVMFGKMIPQQGVGESVAATDPLQEAEAGAVA